MSFEKPGIEKKSGSEPDGDSESLLKSQISEIQLNNLNQNDLMRIRDSVEIKDIILNAGYEISLKFEQAKKEFITQISQAYSEEELENSALYHILVDSEINENVEHLDLEGEYSIEDFLREFKRDNL